MKLEKYMIDLLYDFFNTVTNINDVLDNYEFDKLFLYFYWYCLDESPDKLPYIQCNRIMSVFLRNEMNIEPIEHLTCISEGMLQDIKPPRNNILYIPPNVVNITDRAFDTDSLANVSTVIIDGPIQSIGSHAFDAHKLQSLNIVFNDLSNFHSVNSTSFDYGFHHINIYIKDEWGRQSIDFITQLSSVCYFKQVPSDKSEYVLFIAKD